jgi:hypothetical protein
MQDILILVVLTKKMAISSHYELVSLRTKRQDFQPKR